MKNKWLFVSIVLILLISQVALVEAQEPTAPKNSDSVPYSKKSEHFSPLEDNKEPEIANPFSEEVSPRVTPTVLSNGDFESGAVGWTESSSIGFPLILQGVFQHSGTWAAWLGGLENETSVISQSVTVSADSPNLRLWYYIYSEYGCGLDFGYVKIDSTIVHTWDLCSATSTANWVALDLDLSAYNAQTVSLQISATNSAISWSNLFIDDVIFYGTFADVSASHWAWQYIESIYDAGITGGCGTSPLIYCPNNSVSRAQMAVFLEKGINGSAYSPPVVPITFNDTSGHWAQYWIEALKDDGITAGCGGGNYCPANPVTRAQMAVFLLKSKYGSGYTPPAVGASTGFNDVPVTHWAAAWIKQLAAEGITGGCGSGNYCPNNPVTRAQMAVFLQKTFGLAIP